jgi:hypothetical protein
VFAVTRQADPGNKAPQRLSGVLLTYQSSNIYLGIDKTGKACMGSAVALINILIDKAILIKDY